MIRVDIKFLVCNNIFGLSAAAVSEITESRYLTITRECIRLSRFHSVRNLFPSLSSMWPSLPTWDAWIK